MIAASLQLLEESPMQIQVHLLLCSPVAQEPRSVCRNYKQAVFKPNVKHKRVGFKSLQLSHKRKGCSRKKKKISVSPLSLYTYTLEAAR